MDRATICKAMSVDDRLFDEEGSHSRENVAQIEPIGDLELLSGARLAEVQVAYQTWGSLNAARDNLVLVCHALTGDSNAVSWWGRIVGPGCVINPDDHFIVCTNTIGGCRGSTGPGTLDGQGNRLGSRFPAISVEDMVNAQVSLFERMGWPTPRMVCGGSMGGMQALEWARRNLCAKAWLTASAGQHDAMQIGFNEAMRQAIIADPKWNGGDFSPSDPPSGGLAVARMIGHLSYLSFEAFQNKFGRRTQDGQPDVFQVESYLRYQGSKFTSRFDAGSLVCLTQAIDRYSCESLEGCRTPLLLTAYTSDWIYPPTQSQKLADLANQAGCPCQYELIDLPYGHDAFLLDGDIQTQFVNTFLYNGPAHTSG
ncbi:MAG: homoserine O-acetyltransferase [Armatimonadetes bacterium]|nr:homoserine O-acetyltransferase [Armatimonadota bacterium]